MLSSIKNSDKLFLQFAENLTNQVVHIMEHDPLAISYISPSYERIWGRSIAALKARPYDFLESVVAEDRERVDGFITDQRQGLHCEVTYRIVRPDGEIRWIRDTACPVFDQDGLLLRSTGVAEDITAERQAQMALQHSQQQLRRAVKISKVGFFEWDIKADLLTCNEQMQQDWGIAPVCSLKDALAFIHDDDREQVAKQILSCVEMSSPYTAEYRVVRRDSSIIWVAAEGEITQDQDGAVVFFFGTVIDITERRHRNEQFRAITELAPQFVWTADQNGNVTYSNTSLIDFIGADAAQVTGSGWLNYIHHEDRSLVLERWTHAMATGEMYEVEFRVRSWNGTYAWFLSRGIPLYQSSSGRVESWLGISVDISARKHFETELKRTSSTLHSIMEASPDLIYLKDRHGRMVYCNPATLAMLGCEGEQLYGKTDAEFLGPDTDTAAIMDTDAKVMGEGCGVTVEEWIKWPDGRNYLYMSRKEPQRDKAGQVTGLIGISREITDVKRAQQRVQTIFDTFPVFGGLLNTQGIVTLVNNSAVHAIAQKKEDVLGRLMWECPWWSSLPAVAEKIKRAHARAVKGIAQRFDTEYIAVIDGKQAIRYVDFSLIPVTNTNNEVEDIVASGIDITSRVKQAQDILVAKEAADHANISKTAFLANMSHEIRTPMAAVLGFTELLRSPDIDEIERQDALSRIEKSGRGLLKLIDDILDISKVESGKLSTEQLCFSPLEAVTDVTGLLRLQAEQKGLKLNVSISNLIPQVAYSDPARVRQILTNLIGNAIKFTATGEIKVVVSVDQTRPNRCLVFDVVDTGIGIAESDRQRIFQPFAQADDSISRKFGGTGLGLGLSRKLAQQMGGDLILLGSEVGKGRHFRVILDAGPFEGSSAVDECRKKAAPATNIEKSLSSTNILVVDDGLDNQLLMRRFLESAGAHVDIAGNGEEAVTKATSTPYDLVLMDIQMPLVDGIQATRRLRERGFDQPILALTAHAMNEEVTRSLAAGCNEHLTKPISRKSLVAAVSRYI